MRGGGKHINAGTIFHFFRWQCGENLRRKNLKNCKSWKIKISLLKLPLKLSDKDHKLIKRQCDETEMASGKNVNYITLYLTVHEGR